MSCHVSILFSHDRNIILFFILKKTFFSFLHHPYLVTHQLELLMHNMSVCSNYSVGNKLAYTNLIKEIHVLILCFVMLWSCFVSQKVVFFAHSLCLYYYKLNLSCCCYFSAMKLRIIYGLIVMLTFFCSELAQPRISRAHV